MAKQSKAQKALDREIDVIYRNHCANIVIDLFDIPKVFQVGRQARVEGKDMTQAIVDFVNSIKKERP